MPTEPAWKKYLTDYNEGLGLVYERFVLNDFLLHLKGHYGFYRVLEAPLYGMAGVSGINSVALARIRCPVTLADDNPERIAGIERIWGELALPAAFAIVEDWSSLPYPGPAASTSSGTGRPCGDWRIPPRFLPEMVRCANHLVFVAVPNPVQVGYQVRKHIVEPEFVKEVDERWTDIGMIRRQLQDAGGGDPGTGRARRASLARHGDAGQRAAAQARHPVQETGGQVHGRGLALVHHGLLPGPAARPVRSGDEVRLAGALAAALARQAGLGAPSLAAGPAPTTVKVGRQVTAEPGTSQQ